MIIQNGLVYTMESEQPAKMDLQINDGKIAKLAPSITLGTQCYLNPFVKSGAIRPTLPEKPRAQNRNFKPPLDFISL